jgi:hypothetical protein
MQATRGGLAAAPFALLGWSSDAARGRHGEGVVDRSARRNASGRVSMHGSSVHPGANAIRRR